MNVITPCHTSVCLYFTALWRRQSQSILIQEFQQPKDIDLSCYKTLPTKSITCLQVGPCPLSGSDQYGPSSSYEDLPEEHPEDALPSHPHLSWRRGALQPPHGQQDGADRNACIHLPDGGLRCVTWNIWGLHGSVFQSQRNREQKLNYFGQLVENTDVICLQEVHGKNEFLQAIQVWAPRFRLFSTSIPGNENAGGSAICIHKDFFA